VYLRFITQFIDESNRTQTGFFNAMDFVTRHRLTRDEDEVKLKDLYAWFKTNLDAPPWFVSPKGYRHETKALSWFKDSAKEHIGKVQEVMEVLERYDVKVERIWTKEPGQIVFEDEFQISAVPWAPHRKRVV
jgi:hypothetical protein